MSISEFSFLILSNLLILTTFFNLSACALYGYSISSLISSGIASIYSSLSSICSTLILLYVLGSSIFHGFNLPNDPISYPFPEYKLTLQSEDAVTIYIYEL